MQENVQVHSFTAVVVIDYMDAYATARVHIVCEVDLLRTDSVVEQIKLMHSQLVPREVIRSREAF